MPRKAHERGPAEEGLRALGDQIDEVRTTRPMANEHRLLALGDRIDSVSTRHRSRRRNGKPRWSLRRKIVVAITILVTSAVAIVGIGYAYVRYQFDQVRKAPCHACVHVAAGKPYNLLVIGSDSRAGNTGQAASSFGTASAIGGQRSDTIKIFRIDPVAGTARVLSIPRDTYVTTSGLSPSTGLDGPEKINAAFNNGPEALIETIQNTFGISISHWIVIDFDGVIDSVKALGGIKLDFRYPVRDDNDGVNESGLAVTQTGCQELNGAQVLALSRSRYYEYFADGEWQIDPSYDLGRILRQNVIIEAMIEKAKSTYNPLTLQSLVDSVKRNIVIDNKLTLGTLYDLIARYHAFSARSLQTWSLPTVGQSGTPAGDVELVNTEPPNDYVDTIAQFLGGPAAAAATPPLDQYGYPIAVPTTTTTTTNPQTTPPGRATAQPPAPSSLPPYDPSLC